MTSVWRTSGWVLVGAALILALSLGVRHGFGLFLGPMSADFGWGRGVFAFAIALQNLIWGLAQPFAGALADRLGAARVVIIGGILYAVGLILMGLADSPWSLSLSAGLLIGIGLSGGVAKAVFHVPDLLGDGGSESGHAIFLQFVGLSREPHQIVRAIMVVKRRVGLEQGSTTISIRLPSEHAK
mgnify:CR=1 FL=1